jgi:hypothetical protein
MRSSFFMSAQLHNPPLPLLPPPPSCRRKHALLHRALQLSSSSSSNSSAFFAGDFMRRLGSSRPGGRAYESSLSFHALRGAAFAREESIGAVVEQLLLIGVSQRVIQYAEFVFASFSAQYKIEEGVWGVWMRLLKRVPRSVLWLMNFNDESSENVMALARAHLGDEHWRVVITMLLPRKVETVVKGFWADLALDTWLINGHTTAAETGWHGLPMVAAPGSLHYHTRLSSSITMSLASPSLSHCPSASHPTAHLVARNAADYFDLAAAYALSSLYDRRAWRRFVPNVLAGALFDGKSWAEAWGRGLKMARDIQWMTDDDDKGGVSAGEDFAACEEVLRGGEEGAGGLPRSVRVCARAIAGKGARTPLLRFNVIVSTGII